MDTLLIDDQIIKFIQFSTLEMQIYLKIHFIFLYFKTHYS